MGASGGRRLTIFLDDGGVMNDNRLRGEQWQRLVGEFFVPRFGGAPEAWEAANHLVATRMFEPESWQTRMRATESYASFDRQYQIDWMRWMCGIVGVAPPPDDECVALAHEATRHITRRVRAAFPGVVEAIRVLHARGYVLHTASGEPSEDLEGYLQGMGVRECFGRLYGPDLVDVFKDGSHYYERIFADAGTDPKDALVVDDNADVVRWVEAVGATAIRIGEASGEDSALCLHGLADLPTLVDGLE